MTQEDFRKKFNTAAIFCHSFTNKHVNEKLPKSLRFLFSDKSSIMKADKVIPTLWQGKKIPVWISLYVLSFDEKYTTIKIDYSDEFSADEKLFFHKQNGIPPFHISGPTTPEKWKSLEENGTFPFEPFR